MANPLMSESVWFNQQKFEQAEAQYQCILAGTATSGQAKERGSSLVNEIAQARQEISKVLKNPVGGGGSAPASNMESLERENRELRKVTEELRAMVLKLDTRVTALERGGGVPAAAAASAARPAAAAAKPKPEDDDSDFDDFDMFGDDDDDEAAAELEQIKAQRVAEYQAKKSKKPALIAKSNIILEVKPWDDETDMKKLEEKVRTVQTDGLKWGSSKLVPVGYGIMKLQIMCVVEDDKVGTDFLEENITAFEDYVQSVDIVAFNKI